MKNATPNDSFSKAAKEYDAYAYLQQVVARELASHIDSLEYESVLDLGCGTGALWRALPRKPARFVGIDKSPQMLELHPQESSISLIQGDFDDATNYADSYDLITASSSLQWSKDLNHSFELIASSARHVALAIFTSSSLWELHEHVGSRSPIPSRACIEALLYHHFEGDLELRRYPLSFPSRAAMLTYLRRSGISGNDRLSFTQSKKIFQSAPFERLTFEVIFFIGKPLHKA